MLLGAGASQTNYNLLLGANVATSVARLALLLAAAAAAGRVMPRSKWEEFPPAPGGSGLVLGGTRSGVGVSCGSTATRVYELAS